jgi:N-acetyl-anhydromuramyl-L-alanine amidase AmpD
MAMIDDWTPHFWKGRTTTECLVLHYTANESLSEAIAMMRARAVSAHYIVGRDGETHRLVRERDRAWHAGQSAWNGKDQVNQRSIGVEMVNFGWGEALEQGRIRRTEEDAVRLADGPVAAVRDDRPASAGFVWAAFPEAQLLAVLALVTAIVRRQKLDPTQVIGHEHIAPGRKRDPGPAFPWPRVTAALADVPHRERWVTRAVQSHCARLGCAPAGGIDGAWGGQTEQAIAAVVERHGAFYGLVAPAKTWAGRRAFAEALRGVPG